MKKFSLYISCMALLFATVWSCSRKDDAYIDFVHKENLIYLGKVDSVNVFPGHNRVKLSWKLTADPQVTKIRLYWNNYKDSIELPVHDDKRLARMEIIISGLLEGKQSLYIITYDDEGNRSVPVEVLVEVYGDQFIGALLPRTIRNAELFDVNVKMEFFKADTTITSTEIRYIDKNGVSRTMVLLNTDSVMTLPNYPAGGSFDYRSWYRPDAASIDSLAANWVNTHPKENISVLFLKNNKYPFQYANYDGTRYGSLKDWKENPAAKQKGPGKIYGAYDNYLNSQSFGLSKTGTSDPNIANGKVYQTITLPAGKYELVWTTDGNFPSPDNTGTQPRFIAVAAGDSLPNADKINATSALGYASFAGVTTARAPFTLSEQKMVSVGVVVNFTTAPQSFRAYEVRLLKVPE